jgi:hypothetical protein
MLGQAALLFALGLGPMSAATEFVARLGFDTARETADARAGYPDGAKLIALSLVDRGNEVFDRFPHLLAGSAQRGTLGGVSGTYGARAYCHLLDGELSEAQVDAETAIRISVDSGFKTPLMSWIGAAVPAMTARGEPKAAVALIDRHAAETAIAPDSLAPWR